jgi:hypothetical protein
MVIYLRANLTGTSAEVKSLKQKKFRFQTPSILGIRKYGLRNTI